MTFRAYGGKETSKKVRNRFNISTTVCLQFTNKIGLDMAEKGRSEEGMRTKCAPGDIEPVPHRSIPFQSNKMKWKLKIYTMRINDTFDAVVTFIQMYLGRPRILANDKKAKVAGSCREWSLRFCRQDRSVHILQGFPCWNWFWVHSSNWIQSILKVFWAKKHWIHSTNAVQTELSVVSSARTSLSSSKV